LNPHPPSPPPPPSKIPSLPLPPIPPSSPCPPIDVCLVAGLLIYALCERPLQSRPRRTTPHSWRLPHPPRLPGLGIIDTSITIHSSPSSPPPLPRRWDIFVLLSLLLPKPPAPPCIKYLHYPPSLLASSFLGLLVVLLALFGCFWVPSARMHWTLLHVKSPRLSPREFLFGFFCRDLGLFFICLVYVAGFVIFVLSHLSHPYPPALTVALPSS
jgi:hypothetical protein